MPRFSERNSGGRGARECEAIQFFTSCARASSRFLKVGNSRREKLPMLLENSRGKLSAHKYGLTVSPAILRQTGLYVAALMIIRRENEPRYCARLRLID
jgi:hypothetical protein